MTPDRPRGPVRAAALAVAALLAVSCSAPPPRREEGPPARHLLLVTMDTTRADRLGCYGRPAAGTGWIDALAARGTVVDPAYAQVPLTLPSHMAILTGLFPVHTGIHMNGDRVPAPGASTLAEILGARGWYTAAAVGGYPLAGRFPVSRGFEKYDDRMADPRNPEGLERPAGEVVQAAASLLGGRGDRPLFLWVHFFDPHDPYEPPSPWREQYAGDPYQGEIARVDGAIRDLAAIIERELRGEPLLVALLSDHGESLGEHGEETHGFFLYEPTVRIPLVLAGPRVPAGLRLAGPAQTVDLVPTVLALLDVATPPGRTFDGRDLFAEAPAGEAPAVFLETELPLHNYGWSPLHGALQGSRKAILAPTPELYDLKEDPSEQRNLAASSPTELAELEAVAGEILAGATRSGGSPAEPDPLLASLGYVSTGAAPAAGKALPDPKDRLETYRLFQQAAMELTLGRAETALPILDRLASAEDTPGLHFRRATALRMLGRLEEATRELDRVAAASPEFPGVHMERTRIALAPPHPDPRRGLDEVSRHIETAPNDAGALMFRGAAREMLGQPAEAEADYRRALELNPAFGGASLRLAALLVRASRLPEARIVLQERLRRDPSDELARGLLASLGGAAG